MSDTIITIPILNGVQTHATSSPLFDVGYPAVLKFDTLSQEVTYATILTDHYLSGNLRIKIIWTANPYVAGTYSWLVSFYNLKVGESISKSLDTSGTISSTDPGTSVQSDTVTFPHADLAYSGSDPVNQLIKLNFKLTGLPTNAAAIVGHIYLGGNLLSFNPKRHGKLTGLTSA